MYPFSGVRMNQIFGSMPSINLNGGVNDYDGLISRLLSIMGNNSTQSNNNPPIEHNIEPQGMPFSMPLSHNPMDMERSFGSGATPITIGPSNRSTNNQLNVAAQADKGRSDNPERNIGGIQTLSVDPTTGRLRSLIPGADVASDEKKRQFNENLNFKEQSQNENIDLKKSQLGEKTATDTGKLGIAAARADTYRFKATHPDWKMVALPGGTVQFVNPQDPTQTHDTGWDSGKMNEQDKLELIGDQAQQNILTKGDVNTNLQDLKGTQALDQIAAHIAGQKEVNENKPQRGELPTQTKTRQNLTAHELINRYPEYNPYIVFNGDGTVGVKRSTPPDVAKRINDVLYPAQKPATTTSGRPGSSPDTKPSAINITKPSATAPSVNHIQVQDKDGKKFWADSKDVPTLLTQGYTKVGGEPNNNDNNQNDNNQEE